MAVLWVAFKGIIAGLVLIVAIKLLGLDKKND